MSGENAGEPLGGGIATILKRIRTPRGKWNTRRVSLPRSCFDRVIFKQYRPRTLSLLLRCAHRTDTIRQRLVSKSAGRASRARAPTAKYHFHCIYYRSTLV